jgi:hypothetical protein
VFAGPNVRGVGRSRWAVRTVVYSTSFTAHMLELGTAAHDIPVPDRTGITAGSTRVLDLGIVAKSPGNRRYPHFWPGFASRLGPGLAKMSARGIAVTRAGGRIHGAAAGPELFGGPF